MSTYFWPYSVPSGYSPSPLLSHTLSASSPHSAPVPWFTLSMKWASVEVMPAVFLERRSSGSEQSAHSDVTSHTKPHIYTYKLRDRHMHVCVCRRTMENSSQGDVSDFMCTTESVWLQEHNHPEVPGRLMSTGSVSRLITALCSPTHKKIRFVQ